jgi:hypothetical protein
MGGRVSVERGAQRRFVAHRANETRPVIKEHVHSIEFETARLQPERKLGNIETTYGQATFNV